jgi:hypothetical protein
MNIVETIVNAIWEGFEAEDNCFVNRQMDVIDTGGYFETFDMTKIAEHVLKRLDETNTITTVEQLDALPIPGADALNGVIIRAYGIPGFGDIYERNTDGTWGLLATPSTYEVEGARTPSRDVPLPSLVIWAPEI